MDKPSFDKALFTPQLQAKAGILVAFAAAVQRLLRASWPLLVYLVFRISKNETLNFNGWLTAGLLLVLLAGLLIYAWLWYKNFRFYIDPVEQVFILEKGIWNKKKTIIQLHKVQQVNTSQHVIQQLMDVHSLEIETAGSAEPEIQIKAVTQATATALKAYLMESRTDDVVDEMQDRNSGSGRNLEAGDDPDKPSGYQAVDDRRNGTSVHRAISDSNSASEGDAAGDPFKKNAQRNDGHRVAGPNPPASASTRHSLLLAIPLRRLFLFGISTNYIESFFVLAGFFFTLYDDFKSLFSQEVTGNRLQELAGPLSSTFFYVLLIGSLLLLIFVFNLMRSILPYYDFRIFHKKEGLHLAYGLLKQKKLLLRLQKVKLVRLSQNPIQALWRLHRLTVQQTISPEQQNRNSTIVIPACTDEEAGQLTHLFFNGQPQRGQTFRPDIRKIIPLLLVSLLLLALLTGFLWSNAQIWWHWMLLPGYILLSSRMIYLAYRNNALYVHPDYILYQRGIWTKELTILRPDRIQSINLRQVLWHQKPGIGHLTMHTAGGSVSFRYGKFPELKALADYWLYQIEVDPRRQEI